MHVSTGFKLVGALWGIAFLLASVVLLAGIRRSRRTEEKKSPHAIARTVADREQAVQENGESTMQTVVMTQSDLPRRSPAQDYGEG